MKWNTIRNPSLPSFLVNNPRPDSVIAPFPVELVLPNLLLIDEFLNPNTHISFFLNKQSFNMSHADGDFLPVLDLCLQLRDLVNQLLRPLHPFLPGFPRRHGIPCSLDCHHVVGVVDGDGRQWLVPSLGADAGDGGVMAVVGGLTRGGAVARHFGSDAGG